ncbi:MAG: hydrogenase iron-sulfur subunit [Candidatus Thiodiazotropha sp. (ex Lucinoma aequizonata)]|nr:hydrogenase iron-sulfur subunit [Candidatus Thiodiazotropha sp. (ex Lucinoma aequizonata)]MCU7887978.1 hydrogenase iron-sulfur subunit [Candidatus Thiodiazotropha sp. (ex Lucinoma aequizonata)]MCU7893961.1 hydrogenase iron-sulfur subunit [Candidatus Thiodiazotropha sp. (ex Lucinoma aequizonata)]MCU7898025.1 hydrogenase iron-sulfur subunit [Candidatus Thiodiazotropha sp. (ex Lucinoma aequizonata)]MCU7901901.1 hydrogenase iron-sulfur subunit [Candidatus Thiodiazotropha sp. (ex Lucinoma aequizo
MADDKKFAGYVCTGCGLGERLDAGQLKTTATRDGKMQSCKQHEMLCSAEGVQMIKDDIANDAVTHVMVAACSRRAKVEAFNFTDVTLTRANLREGVIWVRPDTDDNKETTQEMADDYIRMACAELKSMAKPSASGEQTLNKNILVVGGGITGMTAAIEAAAAGYPTHLVEKSGALGGAVGSYYKVIPRRSPYDAPAENPIPALSEAIEADGNITVHLNSTLTKTDGAPGRFSADIATESGTTETVSIGAIIQASGWKPYDANQLPEFAYGKIPDVLTNHELEALAVAANDGPIKRPSDGKEVQSVCFIQNAGQCSDKDGHLTYFAGVTDLVSIKQAMYFKELNGECDTIILFDNLRTPGAGGEDFYRAGQNAMVTFSKGIASEVVPGDSLTVKFDDKILNEQTEMACDLVVLATGMEPNSGPDPYAQLMINEAEDQEEKAKAQAILENAPPSILNLQYRQGTDLPHLKNGFTDSHFICFPYETRRTGIYSAGPVRRPMDIQQARDDATGAALKAIQAAENAGLGRAAHPRSGDLSFPSFSKEGCTQCKRCTVECPFGAINEDKEGYPTYNESRCRRCGTCMGACPVRVISFENYSVETVNQQIKHVDIPEEWDEKPRILVLACENDAYPALDQAAQAGVEINPWARVIPVRCLGSVSLSWVTDALNNGFDGIVMMGCRRDDDYQCHFVRGSAMAAERMSKVGDTLDTLNLEPERVILHEVAITDVGRAPQLINDMAKTVEKIGLSPFKF